MVGYRKLMHYEDLESFKDNFLLNLEELEGSVHISAEISYRLIKLINKILGVNQTEKDKPEKSEIYNFDLYESIKLKWKKLIK